MRLPALPLLAALALPLSAVTTDWALVGDPGNLADQATGYGAVGYNYSISKAETTLGQYTQFLNATAASDPHGLWNPSMASSSNIGGIIRSGTAGAYSYAVEGTVGRPVTYVSWYDAARYSNWIHNGQGSGDTETGAYTLNGANSGIIPKNSGATVWIPTNDEWYKAAYYDPSIGATSDVNNYWLYPFRSNQIVDNSTSGNYYDGDYAVTQLEDYSPTQNYLTEVKSYSGQVSHYGTFDQGGNVWEWIDATDGSSQGLRGGAWDGTPGGLASTFESNQDPSFEWLTFGFRVAGDPNSIPEPGILALVSLTGLVLLRRRRP